MPLIARNFPIGSEVDAKGAGDGAVKCLFDQGALARSGHTRDADQHAEWNLDEADL